MAKMCSEHAVFVNAIYFQVGNLACIYERLLYDTMDLGAGVANERTQSMSRAAGCVGVFVRVCKVHVYCDRNSILMNWGRSGVNRECLVVGMWSKRKTELED